MTGIYKIENLITGVVYIGQTKDWKRRESNYKGLQCRSQSRLFNSLAKYGWINHSFDLIHELSKDIDQKVMDTYEKLYIEQYKCNYSRYPDQNGLNLTDGGSGTFGCFPTLERKYKTSNTLKGIPKSEEHRRKISEALKDRKLSETHKQNLRK